MNTVLIILGILGGGAVLIATYVFIVAARAYVSEGSALTCSTRAQEYLDRGASDRRSGEGIDFPLVVNGIVIPKDRRKRPDRRLALS
jgi:hypothetical protein